MAKKAAKKKAKKASMKGWKHPAGAGLAKAMKPGKRKGKSGGFARGSKLGDAALLNKFKKKFKFYSKERLDKIAKLAESSK